jgi:hypothetical protein
MHTRRLPLIAIAALTIALPTAPASADEVNWAYPGGSYRQTCSNIGFSENRSVLSADCGKKGSGSRLTRLNIIYCKAGSIWNDDGNLRCDRDEANAALYYSLANKSALDAAAVIVMGRKGSDADNVRWMTFALKQPEAAPAIKETSLAFSDAALVLRKYLTQAAAGTEIEGVVRAAYQQAYGKPMGLIFSDPNSAAAVKSGKAWYATLVIDFKTAKPAAAPTPTAPRPPIG